MEVEKLNRKTSVYEHLAVSASTLPSQLRLLVATFQGQRLAGQVTQTRSLSESKSVSFLLLLDRLLGPAPLQLQPLSPLVAATPIFFQRTSRPPRYSNLLLGSIRQTSLPHLKASRGPDLSHQADRAGPVHTSNFQLSDQ